MKRPLLFLLGAMLHSSMPAVAADGGRAPVPRLPTQDIAVAGHTFRVELALTASDKERGLMYRDSLPEGHGMLFRFDPPAAANFWMKDVRFPLDLLYLDGNGCLISHHDRVPPCTSIPCALYPSRRAVSWVLELPAGTREGLGLADGDCSINLKP